MGPGGEITLAAGRRGSDGGFAGISFSSSRASAFCARPGTHTPQPIEGLRSMGPRLRGDDNREVFPLPHKLKLPALEEPPGVGPVSGR